MTQQQTKEAGEIGWDSPLDPSESSDDLLPDGEVLFTVVKLERVRKEMGKFGMCNVAVVTLLCTPVVGDGQAEVKIQLPLVKKMLWKVLAFFTSIGQRAHGDEGLFTPNWSKVESSNGRARIAQRSYNDSKNRSHTVNDIEEFLAPDELQQTKKDDEIAF